MIDKEDEDKVSWLGNGMQSLQVLLWLLWFVCLLYLVKVFSERRQSDSENRREIEFVTSHGKDDRDDFADWHQPLLQIL